MIKTVKSEEGSVVLLALMVLLLITMFGFSALNTADTELLVAQSTRCYKQNLYRAEGMVMEAAQILNATAAANLLPSAPAPWLSNGSGNSPEFDPETQDWSSSAFVQSTAFTADVTDPNRANFTVVFEGEAPGSSLTMGGPTMWQYAVYGRSDICGGEIGVLAGYRRQF